MKLHLLTIILASLLFSSVSGNDKGTTHDNHDSVTSKEPRAQNISGIKSSANKIASQTDLKKQREHFASLSNDEYGLAKSLGAGKAILHDHCPLAFDNKGQSGEANQRQLKIPATEGRR